MDPAAAQEAVKERLTGSDVTFPGWLTCRSPLLSSDSHASGMQAAAAGQGTAPVDPAAARKAEEEAEERRLAEIRSHGTMVTPQTFAEWKKRFDAEMALQKAKLQGSRAAPLCRHTGQEALACACHKYGPCLRTHYCAGAAVCSCGLHAAFPGDGCMCSCISGPRAGMRTQELTAQGTRSTGVQQGSSSSGSWRPMLRQR